MFGLRSETDSWEESGRRLEAARARSEATMPRACPSCGGVEITPTFAAIGLDEWECWAGGCRAVWVVDR